MGAINVKCYAVTALDRKIASLLLNSNDAEALEEKAYSVAILRGLYDASHDENIISDEKLIEVNKALKGKESKMASSDASMTALKVYQDLQEWRSGRNRDRLNEMRNSTRHLALSFKKLFDIGWNTETRHNRINMIATLFTQEVNKRMAEAAAKGISLSRLDIVNGRKVNGKYYDGQFSIFESIFDDLMSRYMGAVQSISKFPGKSIGEKLNNLRNVLDQFNTNKEKVENSLKDATGDTTTLRENLTKINEGIDKLNKLIYNCDLAEKYLEVLNNWAPLCAHTRMRLRDTEGLKLGNTLEYAMPTTPDDFTLGSPLEDNVNLEESVRDGWMITQKLLSAFGCCGAEVRRFLSTIPRVVEGDLVKDDLGFTTFMDPLYAHSFLTDALRGVRSESQMIDTLLKLAKDNSQIKEICKALGDAANDGRIQPKVSGDVNPSIVTQLLMDMHKNMIPYSALVFNKTKDVVVKILNRKSNPLRSEYALFLKSSLAGDNETLFSKGKVNWSALVNWALDVDSYLPYNESDEFENDIERSGKFATSTNRQKIDFIVNTGTALGIWRDAKTAKRAAQSILSNKRMLRRFLTSVQNFNLLLKNNVLKSKQKEAFLNAYKYKNEAFQGTETEELRNSIKENLDFLENKGINYETFINRTVGETKASLLEHVNNMLDVVSEATNDYQFERSVPWFDRKGKTNILYSDRTPSYMGDLSEKIHSFVENRDMKGLKDFIMDKWGNSTFFYDKETGKFRNIWLQELYDSIIEVENAKSKKKEKRLKKNALARIFTFDEFLGANTNNKTPFENFTQKKHAEAMIKQFLQPSSVNQRGVAKYPCFILGDSGAQMFFTAHTYARSEILNGMVEVFKQEYERRKYVKATNEVLMKGFADYYGYKVVTDTNGDIAVADKSGKVLTIDEMKKLGFDPIENFSETYGEFTMLKFLNSDFKDGKYWKILTGENKAPATKAEGVKIAEKCLTTAYEQNVKAAIETYMEDAVADFKERLVSLEILKKNEEGKYDRNDKSRVLKGVKEIEKSVEDFYWNTKYATIQQLQFFTVDPAFYDHRYPVKDLQKRYKEIYAPGKGLSVEALDYAGNRYAQNDFQRVVYFKDIELSLDDYNEAFMNVLKDTFKDRPDVIKTYSEITLTDGQGYRTLDSYRAVKGMAGEWTRNMEDAYNEIVNIRSRRKSENRALTNEELQRLAELAVVFQPIKPYMYTLEKLDIGDGDMALIPVQHKYAEIVLIPELMKDGKLRDLAIWMEERTELNDLGEEVNAPIDMVASTKCVKVGAFGAAHLKGKGATEIASAMDAAFVHRFNWEDYRIQSGVPEHLEHNQLYGTQIRKLILHNIQLNKDYSGYLTNIFGEGTASVCLPGFKGADANGMTKLNGAALIALYNSIIMANEFDSYNSLLKETGNNQALSDKLLQNIISNSRQAEDHAFGLSIIEEGATGAGEFVIPLGEPGMEHDTSAFLFSLIKQEISKQRIKGGSAVQASSLGLTGYEDSGDLLEQVWGNNVAYEELEMPFKRTVSIGGEEVLLKWEDWCNPDGTLKLADGKEGRPLKIVKASDPEATQFLSWPVSGRENVKPGQVDEKGYYVPLIETKYRGILDLIAYRIPSEKEYSVINGRVFRFTNPVEGGVLKRPASRTATDGSDFDIDKDYFFIREFVYRSLNDSEIEEIWKAIYSEHEDWYESLKEQYNSTIGNASKLAKILGKGKSVKDLRYHHFWTEAGLPGEAKEAFAKYLEEHSAKYAYEVYNPSRPAYENTRAARNNMLIDIIKQRMADAETFRDRYTPGGFEINKEAALMMRVIEHSDIETLKDENGNITIDSVMDEVRRVQRGEKRDPEPEYEASDPTAILVYNEQNQVAGKLIGIFANQNTNYMFSTIMNKFKLLSPIRFDGHVTKGLSDMIHPPLGVDVSVHMAELLAASVDAVKSPVLNFENLNAYTAVPASLLTRLGYTPTAVALLMTQPIIKDVCNYASNNDVSLDIAMTEIFKQYKGKDKLLKKDKLSSVEYNANNATTESLLKYKIMGKNMESAMKNSAFTEGQINILKLFQEITSAANDLELFVGATRYTAANTIGSTWGAFYELEAKAASYAEKYTPENIKKSIDNARRKRVESGDCKFDIELSEDHPSPLINDNSLLDLSAEDYIPRMANNPFGFEQSTKDLVERAALKIFAKHFPYNTPLYSTMRSTMQSLSRFGNLDADTIDSMHREFIVYLLSKTDRGGKFDMDDGKHDSFIKGNVVSNRDYYLKEFPTVVSRLIRHHKEEYPLLRLLSIESFNTKKDAVPNIVIRGIGSMQAYNVNTAMEDWAFASQSDIAIEDPVIDNIMGRSYTLKELAEDLFFYNFYKLGFNFHPTSSISLAPTILKLGLTLRGDNAGEDIGYIDFINKAIKGELHFGDEDSRTVDLFTQMYILNHLDNGKFVFTPNTQTSGYSSLRELAFNSNTIKRSFTISNDSDVANLLAIRKTDEGTVYTPVVGIRESPSSNEIHYYMAAGDGSAFNVAKTGSIEYREVSPLGKRGSYITYFKSESALNSFNSTGEIKGGEKVLNQDVVSDLESKYGYNDVDTDFDALAEQREASATPPEFTHSTIELGQKIEFTDEQWEALYNRYTAMTKSFNWSNSFLKWSSTTEEYLKVVELEMKEFKKIFSDTSTQSNVDLLNRLRADIESGKARLETLNKDGEVTKACKFK